MRRTWRAGRLPRAVRRTAAEVGAGAAVAPPRRLRHPPLPQAEPRAPGAGAPRLVRQPRRAPRGGLPRAAEGAPPARVDAPGRAVGGARIPRPARGRSGRADEAADADRPGRAARPG